MSEALQLLNSLNIDDYVEKSIVNDILTIDVNGRITNVPGTEILLGVETDQDVERKYFECPRIVGDNIDLSTLSLRVHYQNAGGERDKYPVGDVTVNGDKITFSWLLSEKVLRFKGSVMFTVVAVKVLEDGTVKNAWNTTLASGNVLEGLPVDDLDYAEEEQARDVLAQLLRLLELGADDNIHKLQNEGETQIQNIQDAGSRVLSTIPLDYQDTVAAVNQNADVIYDLQRTKASAITEEVVDEVIYVDDAAAQPPVGLSLLGKTDQSKYTNGYQLFDASRLESKSGGGCDIINHGDGSFTITGSGTISESIWTFYTLTDEEYSKIMQVGNILYVNAMPITNPFIFFGLYDSASANIASLSNRQGVTEKLTITQDLVDQSVMARFYILGNLDSTITPGTIKPMFYIDGDGTWERFSGGKPGPNPEYQFGMTSIKNPTVYKGSKNLLYLTDRTQMDATNGTNTAARAFTGNYVLPGYAYNNYYFPSNISELSINSTTVSFKSTSLAYGVGFDVKVAPNTTYTLSFDKCNKTNTFISATEYDADGLIVKWTELASKKSGEFTTAHNTAWVVISVQDRNSDSLGSTAVVYENILLSVGENNTGYEVPAKIQTIDLPYELNGIDITDRECSDRANYVDSDGRLYYGDEIDLDDGILHRRLNELVLDGSRTYHINNYMNSNYGHYVYGTYVNDLSDKYYTAPIISDKLRVEEWDALVPDNYVFIVNNTIFISLADQTINTVEALQAYLTDNPITVLYAPTESTEIALTEDEIAAYRQVLMSYPITTLYNSANAPMKLKYGADTKKYVETHGGGSINPDDLVGYVTQNEFETALDEIIAIQEALIGGDA